MVHRSTFVTLLSLLVAGLLLGCGGGEAPTQRIQVGSGALHMSIGEAWALDSLAHEEAVYDHPALAGVRLRLAFERYEFGQPLRVGDVKSIIGRELNSAYGGVNSRISLGGNAMIHYTRDVEVEDEDTVLHTENWVVARPAGYADIAQVTITLEVPVALRNDPAVRALIEALDRQVGDAQMTEA